jgi:hypothetical protein
MPAQAQRVRLRAGGAADPAPERDVAERGDDPLARAALPTAGPPGSGGLAKLRLGLHPQDLGWGLFGAAPVGGGSAGCHGRHSDEEAEVCMFDDTVSTGRMKH